MKKLFVEGGGNHNVALQSECRRAFCKLLEKAGFAGRMPRIVACGSRQKAYDQFCTAIEGKQSQDVFLLLVDSETAVTETSPWKHVKKREGGGREKPDGATDEQLHLMVECMESWFLADREAMRSFFGQGFRDKALPSVTSKIEKVKKEDLLRKLSAASKATAKGKYGKGKHSFKLLAQLDPELVRKASPWADRFFSSLETVLPGG